MNYSKFYDKNIKNKFYKQSNEKKNNHCRISLLNLFCLPKTFHILIF